jgi:hypothetical protein
MPEEKRSRGHYAPIWGIFLLFLGIVFLLQSLDVLPWALWGTLWHFWPVLIIIIGLGFLLARFNVWLVSVLILALLFACLGIAIWQYGPSAPIGQSTESYSAPLGGLEQAQIEVDLTLGSLTMSSLPLGSLNFVEADSKVRNGNAGMRVDFRRQDSEGRLYLSEEHANLPFWNEDDNRYQVRLTRNIPLTLNIKSTVSDNELDLSGLKVTELRLDIDAANCKVTMPSSTETVNAYIDIDAANLEVDIPDGVAAKIQADTNLGSFDINGSRFTKQGDYYISEGFDTAQNRIYLEIDSDVSRVQIK